jgi:hypothetical protein
VNNASGSSSLFKKPSAWIPLAMSLAALTMILVYVAVFGIVQHQDEGAPARIFQLIMAAQLPVMAYFAIKWLPKRTTPALVVLAAQTVAWVIPILTIVLFEGL